MAKLGNLFISLFADTAQFSSGLGKAKADLNSWGAAANAGLAKVDKAFSGLGRSVKDIGGEIFSVKGALTALVGTVGIGSIVEMGKQAVEAVGGLGELASQIGVTTDTLQTFRYAATQVGVSQEEMDASLAKLTKTIGLAATGNKAAIDSFNQFGIKVLDAQGNVRSTDDVLRDAADAMAALPDPAQRAALATELMGKAGQKMIPFLEGGAAGIDALVKSAKDLGLVFDEETIRTADEAADKLATLSLVLKTQFQAALVELAPLLTEVAGKMIDFAGAVNRVFQDIKPDDEKDLDALERKFERLSDQFDELQAKRDALFQEQKNNPGAFGGFFGRDFNAEVNKIDEQIGSITGAIERVHSLIDDKQLQNGLAAAGGGGAKTGASNPTATPTGKTDADREVEAAQKKLQQLQDQVAEIGKTGGDLELTKALEGLNLQNPGVAALVSKFREAADAIQADKEKTDELDAAWKRAQESMAAWNKEQEEGRQISESVRTPQEEYAVRMAKLNQLLADGALDGIDYGRAVEAAKKQMDDANSSGSILNTTMTELGSTFSSAFEDAVINGNDLHSVLMGLLKDIERLALRITEGNFVDFLTGGNGNTSGGSGGFLNTAWNWVSGLFGGGQSNWQSSTGNPHFGANSGGGGGGWFSGIGDWFSSIFHEGGVVGRSGAPRRSVPSFAFAGAPRLHTGGSILRAGEVPIIARVGETVLTPEQMADMGSGGVNFTYSPVINAQGAGPSEVAKIKAIADKSAKDAVSQFKASINAGGADARVVGRRR